jgi:hypothetical protein
MNALAVAQVPRTGLAPASLRHVFSGERASDEVDRASTPRRGASKLYLWIPCFDVCRLYPSLTSADVIPDKQHSSFKWLSEAELLSAGDVHDNTKAYFRSPNDTATDLLRFPEPITEAAGLP